MVCVMNVISIFVVLGSVVRGQVEVAKDDNIEHFALLCRIYNVAKNPPINHVDMKEGHYIVKEIDTLNKSLLEEERLYEKEDAGNFGDPSQTDRNGRNSTRPTQPQSNHPAGSHNYGGYYKKNVPNEIQEAKAEFAQVIFGENENESDLDQGALKEVTGRAHACGDSGLTTRGNSAGKNLVVDFFCLCAQRQDGQGAKQVCGFYVGRIYENGLLGWNESHPIGSATMWASIKGGCGKHMQQHPKSTAEARHILDQFLKHLKTGGVYRWGAGDKVEGSERREGMLGTGVGKNENSGNGPVCNGKKGGKPPSSPGGVCIYYGPKSDNWEEKIEWMKKFKTALASVDYVNNKTANIQRSTRKLQMLLQRAEEIYETAKVISEVQNPVGLPAAFQNTSGNLTTYNATRTRSYSPYPHFMPLWALLLL
ncbi:Variant surface glycoprotein [Trypanosoma congolense IL3000]|uniref:Variant surface glycoprotein n=1 Tax=Trypanosoma congolense (strain IL3000) TaxID=1068625 RepID=F9WJR9_TRYCI|nr:Variant surface glycoprotein [Trypanosoma congolense IL3000]